MAFTLTPGSRYRLTSHIKIGRCEFQQGDVITYTSGGYSPYDDCYVYQFVDASGERRICASQAELTEVEQANFEPSR